jgi:Uma2 family endonuclease
VAASVDKLTITEFERQYADRKPYHEFWFGEAVSKSKPTWLHGLLQKIIMMALDGAGYTSASEVELRISSDFAPVPDVIATAGPIEPPYPTEPVDVVVGILSPEDSFQRLVRKCRLYSAWGIPTIAVLDPDDREGWIWDRQNEELKKTPSIALHNGQSIPLDEVFDELDRRANRK